MLVRDFQAIRAQVGELWRTYALGRLSLSPVTSATNAAIQLARAIEEDIQHLASWDVACHLHYQVFRIALYKLRNRVFNPGPNARLSWTQEDYNLDDYYLTSACDAWRCFQSRYLPGKARKTFKEYDGRYGRFNPSSPPDSSTTAACEDRGALIEIFSEIWSCQDSEKLRGWFDDEFTHAVRHMRKNGSKEHPQWVDLAGCIYMDTIKSLRARGRLDAPKVEITNFHNMVKETFFTLRSVTEIPKSQRPPPTWVVGCAQMMKEMFTWNFMEVSRFIESMSDGTSVRLIQRRHPLLVGTWLQRARNSYNRIGLRHANETGAISFAVQLYRALRKRGLVPKRKWLDLEVLQALQPPGTFCTACLGRDGGPERFVRNSDRSPLARLLGKTNCQTPPPKKINHISSALRSVAAGLDSLWAGFFATCRSRKSFKDMLAIVPEIEKGSLSNQLILVAEGLIEERHKKPSELSRPQGSSSRDAQSQSQDQETPQKALETAAKPKVPKLETMAKIGQLFSPGALFAPGGLHGELSVELTREIMAKGRRAMNRPDEEDAAEAQKKSHKRNKKAKKIETETQAELLTNSRLPCTVANFITHLAYALQDELPETTFDYLLLDSMAWSFLSLFAHRQATFFGKQKPDDDASAAETADQDTAKAMVPDVLKMAAQLMDEVTNEKIKPCCLMTKRLCDNGVVLCLGDDECADKSREKRQGKKENDGEKGGESAEKERKKEGK